MIKNTIFICLFATTINAFSMESTHLNDEQKVVSGSVALMSSLYPELFLLYGTTMLEFGLINVTLNDLKAWNQARIKQDVNEYYQSGIKSDRLNKNIESIMKENPDMSEEEIIQQMIDNNSSTPDILKK